MKLTEFQEKILKLNSYNTNENIINDIKNSSEYYCSNKYLSNVLIGDKVLISENRIYYIFNEQMFNYNFSPDEKVIIYRYFILARKIKINKLLNM